MKKDVGIEKWELDWEDLDGSDDDVFFGATQDVLDEIDDMIRRLES